MTKEQMEIINKVVWFIPFRKKRDAIRNFLILLADRFNNIDNRFNNIDNRFNITINQNQDLLTYMRNVNNVTVNYLFSLKKELAELKGNIQGKNRKAIYTCITKRYDNLFVHTYINNDWDYICFTDDKYLIDAKIYGNWIIKPLCNYDRGGVNADNTRKSRWHKLHPHEVLKDYDYSLWIDGNIDIKTSYIFECVDKVRSKNIDISAPPHFEKDCIYNEADTIIEVKLDDENIVKEQMKLYREEGFPEHYGLNETNIMYRNHKSDKVISIMEEWWQFIENY
ncbi:glycosyltransferase domain-containing protein, partial [Brachyspira catarrhinii]